MLQSVEPLLVNRTAAARLLAVSLSKFASLVAQGRIPAVQIDGAVRFRVSDLEAFATANLRRAVGGGECA
jgi:excisionase family DNA binding protein